MATVKKSMKKAASKRMAAPMQAPMQAPPMGGGAPMMKKGGKMEKAQMGKDVPKDKARTEMGDLVDRKEFLKRQDAMADMLDRQSGKGKYAPKANPAINNKPMGMKDIDKKEYNKLPEYKPKQKNGGKMAKAKSGGSFPDLNKDGKITKADVLKGRGVIAKKGAKVGCMSCGGKMKKK